MQFVDEYRDRVIRAVGCPKCGAAVNHGCVKPVRTLLFGRTTVALNYVHDERSAAHETASGHRGTDA